MIYERDLDEAISECQGQRDPDASTCMKLAAFYTIKHYMYGAKEPVRSEYSYAPAPTSDTIHCDGDSDFSRAIDGKSQKAVLPVLDELMQTLAIMQPKVYDAVMRKLY